jgi:hypothetical protein
VGGKWVLQLNLDFSGPDLGIKEAEYAAVVAEFRKTNRKDMVIEGISWYRRYKPVSTYGKYRSLCPSPSKADFV